MNRRELAAAVRALSTDSAVTLSERTQETPSGPVFVANASIRTVKGATRGAGAARTRETAIDKALVEVVERLEFLDGDPRPEDFRPAFPVARLLGLRLGSLPALENLGRSSVGCAAHPDRSAARRSAVAELLEKHTLLVAQLAGTPGTAAGAVALRTPWGPVTLRPFTWLGPLRTYCTLTELLDQNGGRALFASGAGRTAEASREKSFLEAVLLADNLRGDAEPAPELASCRTIDELKRWHMAHPAREPFYSRPPSPTAPPAVDADLGRADFWVASRRLPCGLFFCRAYSPEVQTLFVGPWVRENTHARFRNLWRDDLPPPYAY